jgi:toxin FitB
MNLLDSSAWLEYFANTRLASTFDEPIQDVQNLIVPAIAIFEVHKRAWIRRSLEHANDCVAVMLKGHLISLNLELALHASAASRHYNLPMADSLVFATAEAYDAILWTCDSDFKDLPNVRYFDKR